MRACCSLSLLALQLPNIGPPSRSTSPLFGGLRSRRPPFVYGGAADRERKRSDGGSRLGSPVSLPFAFFLPGSDVVYRVKAHGERGKVGSGCFEREPPTGARSVSHPSSHSFIHSVSARLWIWCSCLLPLLQVRPELSFGLPYRILSFRFRYAASIFSR